MYTVWNAAYEEEPKIVHAIKCNFKRKNHLFHLFLGVKTDKKLYT